MQRLTSFSSGLMFLACASCASQPHPIANTPPPAQQVAAANPPDWDGFVDEVIEGYFGLHPSFAVRQGRHEFDGRMPDWSAAGLQQQLTWLDAERAKLTQFAAASLSDAQQFQREYVRANLDAEVFFLRELRIAAKSPMYYLGSLDPSVYVITPYAPVAKRAEAFIAYLEESARGGRSDARQPQAAAAQDLRRLLGHQLQRHGRVLPQGRAAGVCGGQRRRAASALARGHRARRTSHARV